MPGAVKINPPKRVVQEDVKKKLFVKTPPKKVVTKTYST